MPAAQSAPPTAPTKPAAPVSSPAPAQPHLAQPDINPSFTKSIFVGELREELMLPFPQLSAEEAESQRMILDAFHSWAAQTVDRKKHERDGKFADGVREGMA